MKFHIDEDVLAIDLQGSEALWALKRKVLINRSQITGAEWHEVLTVPRKQIGFKVGTVIPGGLFAGRFLAAGGKNFLYVRHTKGLLGEINMEHVLVLQLSENAFKCVYVTVDDPGLVDQIISWWSGSK